MHIRLILTFLLVALSWFFAEDLEGWSFLRWWTAGWLALLVEILLGGSILGVSTVLLLRALRRGAVPD